MTWKTVYYVRHGENVANITHELSHAIVDHPLTERGVRQAIALAKDLAGGGTFASPIFTSPLRRAIETAQTLAYKLGALPIQALEELREINVGDLDGRSDAAAHAIYSKVLSAWHAGLMDVGFPGGEDGHMLVARLRAGIAKAVSEAKGAPIIVVGHAGILRAGLSGLCENTPTPDSDIKHCAITELLVQLADRPTDAVKPPVRGALVAWSRAGRS